MADVMDNEFVNVPESKMRWVQYFPEEILSLEDGSYFARVNHNRRYVNIGVFVDWHDALAAVEARRIELYKGTQQN